MGRKIVFDSDEEDAPVSTAPLPRRKNLRKAAADAASSDDEAPEAVRNAEARDDHLRQAEAEAAKPAPKAKKSRKRDRERGLRHAEHLADERAEARRRAAPVSQSLPDDILQRVIAAKRAEAAAQEAAEARGEAADDEAGGGASGAPGKKKRKRPKSRVMGGGRLTVIAAPKKISVAQALCGPKKATDLLKEMQGGHRRMALTSLVGRRRSAAPAPKFASRR